MKLLLQSKNKVVSKEKLERAIYGIKSSCESNALNMSIARLRQKLGRISEEHKNAIVTVPQFGWKYILKEETDR